MDVELEPDERAAVERLAVDVLGLPAEPESLRAHFGGQQALKVWGYRRGRGAEDTWEVAAHLTVAATIAGEAGRLWAIGALHWLARDGSLTRVDAAMRWRRFWAGEAFPVEAAAMLRLLGERPGIALAGVAGMHPSGHVREAAVRALTGWSGTASVALLALRAHDRVASVRRQAEVELAGRLVAGRPEEVREAAPVLLALAGRRGGGAWLDRLAGALRGPDGVATIRRLLRSRSLAARALAVRLFVEHDLVTLDDLVQEIESRFYTPTDRPLAERAIREAAAAGRTDLLVRLLGVASEPVRHDALDALTRDGGGLDHARRWLLARARTVRGLAQARLRDAGVDPAAPYREALAAGTSVRAAILGLAETGGRDDAGLIFPFLTDGRAKVRGAAASAVVVLVPDEAGRRLRALARDPSPNLARRLARMYRAHTWTSLDPESRALLREMSFTNEQWREARERQRREEAERVRRLFGDREPFAIPDIDTDA